MLQDLPSEILVAIAVQLTRKRDIKHLCEVSTSLYNVVTPILYKSITIGAKDEDLLEDINVTPLLQTRHATRNLLGHVKDIEITSRFHTNIQDRCIHREITNVWMTRDDQEEDEEEDEEDDEEEDKEEDEKEAKDVSSGFGRLAEQLMPVLEGCRDGYLRSFTWELGTCVPSEIMGPSGYLPLKQNGIEAIRLVTDGACWENWRSQVALPAFERLKKLSWKGLRSMEEFESLHNALQRISNQLVELELDLVNWDLVCDALGLQTSDDDSDTSEDGLYNLFASSILGISSGSVKQMFPALRVLSLSAVSFKSATREIAHAFNFGSLHSLKLRFCPGWENFLQHVSQSNQQIKLKSLEIQSSFEHEDEILEDTMLDFLRIFEGLEELFIYTSSPSQTTKVWRSALCHKSTLKRFVHHQRAIDFDSDSPYFETESDLNDLTLLPEDIEELKDALQNPLNELNLEFIGLCCLPRVVKSILSPLLTKRSLQVLHIRQSGSDLKHYASWGVEIDAFESSGSSQRNSIDGSLSHSQLPILTETFHDFAQWAFGPEGFSSLRVIAFGDFSYGGRYPWNNVLLCRNDEPPQSHRQELAGQNFRSLAHSDRSLWDLLGRYSNVLEACPATPLFKD